MILLRPAFHTPLYQMPTIGENMKNLLPAFITVLLLNSCAYQFSNATLPPESRHLAVEEITNLTSEAELSVLLRNALQERIANEPGLSLARGRKNQDARLFVRLKNIHNSSVARARLREERARDEDADAYQTVLYRITLTANYQLYSPAAPSQPCLTGDLSTTADLPKMHDREVALRAALRQAAIDLAGKIVSEITETR